MGYITVAQLISKRKNRRKRVVPMGIKIGSMSIRFVSVIVISILALFYLAQSNQVATRGYLINELEQKQTQLVELNERLSVEAVRFQSLKNIKSNVSKLDLVPIDQID